MVTTVTVTILGRIGFKESIFGREAVPYPKKSITIRTWLGVFRELFTISDRVFFCGHPR
jgi:hypothetical protein